MNENFEIVLRTILTIPRMGNSCMSASKISPSSFDNQHNAIDLSSRNSKIVYQSNGKSKMVRFGEIKIFQSEQDLVNLPEHTASYGYKHKIHGLLEENERIYQNDLKMQNQYENKTISSDSNIIILDENDEFIQIMKIALMRSKIAIDNCTYEESRQWIHYSFVPFIDIFH